jgi:hypothetical protein
VRWGEPKRVEVIDRWIEYLDAVSPASELALLSAKPPQPEYRMVPFVPVIMQELRPPITLFIMAVVPVIREIVEATPDSEQVTAVMKLPLHIRFTWKYKGRLVQTATAELAPDVAQHIVRYVPRPRRPA